MYVLQFVSEKGKPVTRPLFAKVVYRNVRGLGKIKKWMLADTAEVATQWKTLEAAERVAAEFSSHPEIYQFTAIPAEMEPVFEEPPAKPTVDEVMYLANEMQNLAVEHGLAADAFANMRERNGKEVTYDEVGTLADRWVAAQKALRTAVESLAKES